MRREAFILVTLLAAAAFAGCVSETRDIGAGISSFDIHVSSPVDLGDEAQDRAITTRDFVLDAMAVGPNNERPLEAYQGNAQLSILYGGRLQPLKEVTFVGGIASGVAVTIPRVFGKAVFWLEDSLGKSPTLAAGASADIIFSNPTIADLQASSMTTPPFTTDLDGYQLRVGGQSNITHRMVITGVTNNGYYLTDIDGVAGGWNSMYIFNFSRPVVVAGANILWFSGGVAEHLGTTQITFPTWEVCDPAKNTWCDGKIPDPTPITNETTYDALNLEALESALVEIDHVQIQDVDADAYDRDSYDTYGQFKVRLYDLKGNIAAPIQVLTKTAAPDFDPRKFKMQDFTYFRGILTELNFKAGKNTNWVIYVRDKNDICGPGYCPSGAQ